MATNLSVRLDDDEERKLDELVKHLSEINFTRLRRSDIVRGAIARMYSEEEKKIAANSRAKSTRRS